MSSWFFGLSNCPWWGMVIYTLVMTHITMVSVTLYLHRHQAHRALNLHPVVSHFFRFWLWLTTGMKTKEWVAVHRKHHAFSDKVGDPHSPKVEGISKVLWQGAELYRGAKKDPQTLEKYGQGTPSDWLERYVYHAKFMRGKQGVALLLLVNMLIFGVPGLTIWAIEMAWTPLMAAGVINGLGHYFGYRNFEGPDVSRNIMPWGLLIAGEELHNNHHAYGTSAKLSVKWYEFDIGWMYIRLLSALGLAKVKRLPPKMTLADLAGEIDLDTVKSLVSNRLHVLANYAKIVVAPVFKQERYLSRLQGSRGLSRRLKSTLVRHEVLLGETDKRQLAHLLAQHKRLKTVYEFRQKLQEIWSKTTLTHQELRDAFTDWCRQAEQSGIEYLENFVLYVKRYRVKFV